MKKKAASIQSIWETTLAAAADPDRARHAYQLVAAAPGGAALLAGCGEEQARVTAALWSGSQALGASLLANPAWVALLGPENVRFPRRKAGLKQEAHKEIAASLNQADYPSALKALRVLRQREILRIAARDLAGLAPVPELIRELSDLADVCLDQVWRICFQQLSTRQGKPYHQEPDGKWRETPGCVLGMGKLGGQELNYSSDVDLLFVYSEEGGVFKTPPGKGKPPLPLMKNHQFFNRLAEMFIAEVTRLAPEGMLYRVDMRLRPEGDTGPLTRSLAGYENYYAQWGQSWERMMLIKARGVAGDDILAAEFLEMVQPFRYPRSIQPTFLQEVAAMKDRIELEVVKSGELERNVKLGRGGIREIEFVAQALQLLHAGKQPFLQGAQTLPCLEKLAEYEWLTREEAGKLATAYSFLRAVEHRLQMEDNLQTHTIPTARTARERLARLMNFRTLGEFEVSLRRHTTEVRQTFDRVLKTEPATRPSSTAFPAQFEGEEARWKDILANSGFRDVDKALRVLREFVEGPGYVHVSRRTVELAHQLLPRFFALCPGPSRPTPRQHNPKQAVLSDPDRVVTRLDSFIAAYGARSTLFEVWNLNPGIFELLVLLFDRSEFLAEMAIRVPDLVDDLVTSGRLRQRKSSEDTLRDLRHGLDDEDQHLWLRRYHQTERMRIGLRDILGLADPEQYLVELSALADACLQYALEVVMARHGLKQPPFTVIGLGKLGGSEIDYGSDLDVVFITASKTKDLVAKSKLAVEYLDLITRRTEIGMLFQMDARLRPDGEKGLLVNTLSAYEEYYRTRAQLWEIQSLTRTRPVAGDAATGSAFQSLAAELSDFSKPSRRLAAYTPEWKARIHHMRMRIEKERTPAGKDALAIKTGAGGLMDAEFVAQALCLEHGWREPNTLLALERGRATQRLPDAEILIQNYRHLRRIEGILRRWSYEGETVLPDDPAPFHRVSVRCGFSTSEAFAKAVSDYRAAVRSVYLQVFPT